jgi:hypothetical protein
MTAATILTEQPSFHGLTGTQPVGGVQVAVKPIYAGTITTVRRTSSSTWIVVTRSVKGAFGDRAERGAACSIWRDRQDGGRYVVDIWGGSEIVEADRTRSLRAAIGVACAVTASDWADSR